MTDLAAPLAVWVVAALLAGAAGGRLAAAGELLEFRWAMRAVTGLVSLFAVLQLFDAAGVAWRPATVATTAALVGAAAGCAGLRSRAPAALRQRWGWGDCTAGAALAVFAVVSLALWIVNPDFIYIWGIKGERFFLAEGIDQEFLARRWNLLRHPAYPHFLPTLYAVTARLSGAFREGAMMLHSVVFVALIAVAVRQIAQQAGASPLIRQTAVAVVTLAAVTFGIGYVMGGAADWVIALAPLLAWPALLRATATADDPGGAPNGDWQVGFAAALAASSKIEGMVLAAALWAALLLARRGAGGRRLVAAALRAALPILLVVLPWLFQAHRFGLFVEKNAGVPDLGQLPLVLLAVVRSMTTSAWHGLPFLLFLLPALLWKRSTRLVALVLGAQLAFYLAVYLMRPPASAEQIAHFVQSNFPRLALHLMPSLLVGLLLIVDPEPAAPDGARS